MHGVFVAGVSEDNYWDDRGIMEVYIIWFRV